ncbi:ketopantoate reductase family protein [Paenibacillus cremeus]|uniref:2-dehydropantoate 2-reductase n=1 Tax=Paenibacillus cremeus TaxID=2163881 RepID=A0A559KBW4_9BACL|nr:2-dehydropantoate 2-reductase [Paenibacillus cremeus]TVY09615.1 2-dehydropantoate 2-reductase [Paenibacillus cremeus]
MSEARFTIVGAGSMGLLFAAKLALSGHALEVEVGVKRREHKEALIAEGIKLHDGNVDEGKDKQPAIVHPAIGLLTELGQAHTLGQVHFIVLTVKQSAFNPEFVREIRAMMGPESWVVCMQNGIGHVELLELEIPRERILLGITTEGAMKSSDVETWHTGKGETSLGAVVYNPASPALAAQKKLAECLERAGFRTFLSKDITRRVWQKLVINSVINPLTAILQVRNGQLPEIPSSLQLMRELFDEAMAMAAALQLKLDTELWEQLLEVCRKTAGNRSSMLQDLQSGRPTEIEAITGGLVREAGKMGMTLQTHQTVYRLVKALEGSATGRD